MKVIRNVPVPKNAVRKRKGTAYGEPLRFIYEVALNHAGNACLNWSYSLMNKGYGKVWYEGHWMGAHRLVCTLVNGPPPSIFHEAAHSCGHGFDACVSPHHVHWLTPKENAAEKLLHDTHNRGERHGLAKLTEADVREIITLFGTISQQKIAERFNVSQTEISRINRGITWGWIK